MLRQNFPYLDPGDDVILQQIDAEEAAEIELERTTVPEEEEAIVEPYSEVEDVAGNMLIDLLVKDTARLLQPLLINKLL